jgi:RND superfamily putative drug exporter
MSGTIAIDRSVELPAEHPPTVGPVGRLGAWTADHIRFVAVAWAVIAVAFGFFAPRVETALSGAGRTSPASPARH